MVRLFAAVLIFGLLILQVGCAELSSRGFIPTEDDPAKASNLYRQGMAYTQGGGVEQSYTKGISLFKQSSHYGSADGAYMVGMSYLSGRGVEQQYSEAALWLALAAKQEHIRAQYQLSILYMNGRGVEEDKVWAAFLVAKAAKQGHQKAAFDLAVSHAKGLGLPVDQAAAWYWFKRAETYRIEHATALRKRMASRSSTAQRNIATVRIQRWVTGRTDRATARYVQQQLTRLGYHPGSIDGVWGKRTEVAYHRFVREQLLLSDAQIDWDMLQRLRDSQ